MKEWIKRSEKLLDWYGRVGDLWAIVSIVVSLAMCAWSLAVVAAPYAVLVGLGTLCGLMFLRSVFGPRAESPELFLTIDRRRLIIDVDEESSTLKLVVYFGVCNVGGTTAYDVKLKHVSGFPQRPNSFKFCGTSGTQSKVPRGNVQSSVIHIQHHYVHQTIDDPHGTQMVPNANEMVLLCVDTECKDKAGRVHREPSWHSIFVTQNKEHRGIGGVPAEVIAEAGPFVSAVLKDARERDL